MARVTGVQSQVESYQRLKKWYLMPPCLALNTIRWWSRVKWSNPGNGVAPSPTPRCSSYWKGSPGLSRLRSPTLLTFIRSGHLTEIRWSFCVSKSLRSLWVSFSRTDARLCILLLLLLLLTPLRVFHLR